MKKTCLTFLLLLSATSAYANDSAYIGGFGMVGIGMQDNVSRTPAQPTPIRDDSDTMGINGGVGAWLGYDWKDSGLPIRTELAATWRYRHDMNIFFTEAGGAGQFATKSDVSTTDFIASALYDLPVDWKWKPYIGGGVGAVYSDVDTYLLNPGKTQGPGASGWDFAWQLQGGVHYPINNRWDFRMDYRYVNLGEIETGIVASGDAFTADLQSHDLRIGASWKF